MSDGGEYSIHSSCPPEASGAFDDDYDGVWLVVPSDHQPTPEELLEADKAFDDEDEDDDF